MKNIIKLLDGKKSYVTMVIIFIIGGLKEIGIEIPEIIWPILGGLGLGCLRAGIHSEVMKCEKCSEDD